MSEPVRAAMFLGLSLERLARLAGQTPEEFLRGVAEAQLAYEEEETKRRIRYAEACEDKRVELDQAKGTDLESVIGA